MSAWQAQSASMALEGTVLTSSVFHLFTQRCTSGTTAALGEYLPDIFPVTFVNLEQCLAKHRNT